jgi:hypothetical protein
MGTQPVGEPGPIQKLAEVFSGELMLPADPLFDQARRVWNVMIDKRPGLIARPRGTADVRAAVEFARHRTACRSPCAVAVTAWPARASATMGS